MKKNLLFLFLFLLSLLATSPLFAQSISVTVGEPSLTLRTGGVEERISVTVSRNSYTGSVTLSLSGLPQGVSQSVTQPDTGNTGSLFLQAGTDAATVNNQTVTVTASGAGVAPASATFLLSVIETRVTITAISPSSVTLTAGGASQTINVAVARSNFLGDVTLTLTGLTSGVTATFFQPGTSNSGSITLQAVTGATVVAGALVNIIASGVGVASGSAPFFLTVNTTGIVLNIAESAANLSAGGSAQTLTVNITRINFSGAVTLSLSPLPAGVTATINQPGTGNVGSIVLQASSLASFSNQIITLTGSGSGIASLSASFQLIVTVSSVRIASLSESAVTLVAGGSSQTIQVTLARTNFFEIVTLGVRGLPSGVTASFSQPGGGNVGSITLLATSGANPVSRQTITVAANSGETEFSTATFQLTVSSSGIVISFQGDTAVNLSAGGGAQTVSVNIARINFTGNVTLSVSGLATGVTATISQPGTGFSAAIAFRATSDASTSNQVVTITASGTGIPSATATLNVIVIATRIRIGISPSSITVTVGLAPQTVNVTVTRSDFAGPVTLSVSGLPPGLEATITQPGTGTLGVISLRALSGAGQVTNQTVTVTAVDGGVPVTAALQVSIAGGGIAVAVLGEPALTLFAGGIAQIMDVTVQRANFTGSVTLSVSGLPSGVVASFSQPGAGNFGSITLQATVEALSVAGQPVTVGATASGIAPASTIFLLSTTVNAAGVTFDPNPVTGGNTTIGTVTLNGIPSGIVTVGLTSNSTLVQVPATAAVSSGVRTGTFAATTSRVNDTQTAIITATLNGIGQGTLRVIQDLQVNTLSFQPNPVTFGSTVNGTVTLSGVPPAGGASVGLRSSDLTVQVPASVTVPEGRNTATFSVTIGRPAARLDVTVTATFNNSAVATLTVLPSTAPSFTVEGITNAASFVSGITSGSIVTIFGTNLTKDVSGVVSAPPVFPLPIDLRGTSVTVNGVFAPLFAIASSGGQDQINLQVPYEVTGQPTVTVVVNNNGVASGGVQASLLAAHPGIFTLDGTNGVIVHSANFQLISAASPAARDEVVVAYATGLGPVSNAPRTGLPALLSPLSLTLLSSTITVGGVPAEILFSGLAPNFAGLYQVNFRVPANVPVGIADVVIQVGAQSSKAVKMAVQ